MLGMILSGSEVRDRVKPPHGCHCCPQSPQSQVFVLRLGQGRGSGAPPALWIHSGMGEGRGERRGAEHGMVPLFQSEPCRVQAEWLCRSLISSKWKIRDSFGAVRLMKGWVVLPREPGAPPSLKQ